MKVSMKNYIVVTGGAGFVGSNLIEFLLKKTNYKIIKKGIYSIPAKNALSYCCLTAFHFLKNSSLIAG